MKLKVFLLTVSIVLSCLSFSFAEEKITLSTYYPAPYGDYDELTAVEFAANKAVIGPTYPFPANDGDLIVEGKVGIGTTAPSEKLEVSGNVKATSFLYSSDASLKQNIQQIPNALDKILQLEGVSFKWKYDDNDKKHNLGLIAQDVEKVFPELVSTSEITGLKSLQYGNLVAPLIEAIKDQQAQIEELKQEIKGLRD